MITAMKTTREEARTKKRKRTMVTIRRKMRAMILETNQEVNHDDNSVEEN